MLNTPEDEQHLFRHRARVTGIKEEIDIVLTNTKVLLITANSADVKSLPWTNITEVMYSPANDPKGRVMVRMKTDILGSEDVAISLVGPTKEQNFAQQEVMRKIITSIRKATRKVFLTQEIPGSDNGGKHVSIIDESVKETPPPAEAGDSPVPTLQPKVVQSPTTIGMTDPLRFVGRIGRIRNDDSYDCVNVESYDSETAEYEVTLLSEPEAGARRVQFSALMFPTEQDFLDAFSNPPHFLIQKTLDMKNIPSGSIVDFSECPFEPIVEGGKLSIRGAYRFVGRRMEMDDASVVRTRILCSVYIATPHESDIVEFENFLFEGDNKDSYNIVCLRGTIVFRDCSINGGVNGLRVGSGNASVKVTFEKGFISTRGGCGVTVEAKAHLTMLQTSMTGRGVGVYVKDYGSYIADHGTITNYSFGLLTCGAGSVSQLRYCTFNKQRHCGVLVNSGAIFMDYCQIANVTGCGIVTCDLTNVIQASWNYCRISNCRCGVRLCGKTELTSTSLAVSECEIGVCIPDGSEGDVDFCNHVHKDNIIDLVNFSVEYSRVTINNIKQSSLAQDRLQRIQEVNDTVLRLSTDRARALGAALYTTWPIKVKRYLTRLDIQVSYTGDRNYLKVACTACGESEPANATVLMQKCGRCKQVCYCNKKCQRDAWWLHKTECKTTNDWQQELFAMDFFDCQLCHKITLRTHAIVPKCVKRLYFCENCISNDYGAVLKRANNVSM